MTYERPDVNRLCEAIQEKLQSFQAAKTAANQIQFIHDINELRNGFSTMATLCHIRHTIDTQDAFYKAEQRFFDETQSTLLELDKRYYQALVSSPWIDQLKSAFGEQLFRIATMSLDAFDPKIANDVTAENVLTTEYGELISSSQIEFRGETLTLSQLGKHLVSPDRQTRKEANEAKYSFFRENEAAFDDVYDRMVRVRHEMALKMGYPSFIEFAYKRRNRSDYDAAMVQRFRDQVQAHIVPLATKLHELQRQRLGLDTLYYYDEPLQFASGNPEPKGDPDWIVAQGRQMYKELSPETHTFFEFMNDNELLDLLSRKGKRVGGYCTVIANEHVPFIFANFNGTSGDVRVLTHEAGHAFMAYCCRDSRVPEYEFPTYEAAEIHSFGMEYLTWDWMDLFFKEDTDKFKFTHLSSAILSIPYMTAVDEFQHFVFANPDATPADRKAAWRDTERKYLPHRNYADNDYLERGGYWHQQTHIFLSPFYYIDYALALICALQLWKKSQADRTATWSDYLRLCQRGGSQSFLDLVAAAGLISPFESGCVTSVIGDIEHWLNQVEVHA